MVGHYNIQPVYDVYANVDGRDLGGVADAVNKIITEFTPKLPRGSFITMRGQVQSMNSAFLGLGVGVLFAIVLVYLLMVVNFQSWLDPFIIIMRPWRARFSGIIWALFLTHTTLQRAVPDGSDHEHRRVATANAILVVTPFANDQRKEGKDSPRRRARGSGTRGCAAGRGPC